MVKIAITGGIACGKSLAGKVIEENGVPVRDADDIAHELMRPGHPVYESVVEEFGRRILGNDGEIDRSVLGSLVFTDPSRRERLNDLVHPHVRSVWTEWLEEKEQDSHRAAAVIVPLLYEREMESGWDAIICVSTPQAEQIKRLKARGLSREDAEVRIAAQMDVRHKMELADVVIFNGGSLDLLEDQTRRALRQILEKSDG